MHCKVRGAHKHMSRIIWWKYIYVSVQPCIMTGKCLNPIFYDIRAQSHPDPVAWPTHLGFESHGFPRSVFTKWRGNQKYRARTRCTYAAKPGDAMSDACDTDVGEFVSWYPCMHVRVCSWLCPCMCSALYSNQFTTMPTGLFWGLNKLEFLWVDSCSKLSLSGHFHNL